MPTATLAFTLPDDKNEHLYAVHGRVFYTALYDLNERLRSLLKHGGVDKMSAGDLAEEIRDSIRQPLSILDIE